MQKLELKVHPPVVLLITLLMAYGFNHTLPLFSVPSILSGLYWYIAGIGILISSAGIWEFRKAHTTINPTTPQKTNYLVTAGIYRLTRNPMYMGMIFIIVAAVFKFGNLYGLLALPFFVAYITLFQIKPEERIIENIFGEKYVEYKNKVGRWF